VLGFSFYNVYLKLSHTPSTAERVRLNYFLIGSGLVVGLGSTDLLSYFGVSFPPLGNIAIALYIYFISLLVINYRLLDLYEIMG
jgi:hypothetical protein